MLKSFYFKFLFIAALLFVFVSNTNAQSFKRYVGRDDRQRLDQRSYSQRFSRDDFRRQRLQKGNRFRMHRQLWRNRCAPGIRSRAFRNGFSSGFRLRGDFENRNFRNRQFNADRGEGRARRGGRIRSI